MAFPLAAGILALAGKPLDLGFWPFDGQTISMNSSPQRGAAPPMEITPRTTNGGNNNNGNRAGRSLADDMAMLGVDPPSLASSPGDSGSSDSQQSALGGDLAEVKPPTSIKVPPLTLPTTPPPANDPEIETLVPEELQAALEDASVAMGDIVDYDDSEGVKGKRSRLATLFAKVAAVASTASPDDTAAVASLVERLVDNNVVKDLAPAAPNWLRFANRPNDGIFAIGKLVQENDQWLLQWSGPEPLNVRFADPSIAEAGANVIILGTIEKADPTTVVEVKYLQKQ
jgi:hypothetical protein